MILAIIGFSMMIFLVSLLISVKVNNNNGSEEVVVLTGVMTTISAIAIFISAIVWISIYADYNNVLYNQQRIEMLEEHNQAIEAKIRLTVQEYLEHEGGVYDFSDTSLMVLLVKLPELKSNELVKQEIDMYMANSDEIKQLKLASIDKGMMTWWLWFGNDITLKGGPTNG